MGVEQIREHLPDRFPFFCGIKMNDVPFDLDDILQLPFRDFREESIARDFATALPCLVMIMVSPRVATSSINARHFALNSLIGIVASFIPRVYNIRFDSQMVILPAPSVHGRTQTSANLVNQIDLASVLARFQTCERTSNSHRNCMLPGRRQTSHVNRFRLE